MTKIITFNEIYNLIDSRIKDNFKGITNLCPDNIKIDNVEFTFYKDKIIVDINGDLSRIESFSKEELNDIQLLLKSKYYDYEKYRQNESEVKVSSLIRKLLKL